MDLQQSGRLSPGVLITPTTLRYGTGLTSDNAVLQARRLDSYQVQSVGYVHWSAIAISSWHSKAGTCHSGPEPRGAPWFHAASHLVEPLTY
jgi:hypothetical protein